MLLYTANIGGYDKLQVTPQPGFDYHLHTIPLVGLDDVKSARYYKILTQVDSDVSIWLDSNIQINCNLMDFVNKWLNADVDMVAMEHGRDCTYEEMDACIERKKDTKGNIERQRKFYIGQKFPTHAGMIGSGILIRRSKESIYRLMLKWFEVVYEYSHRDQLSFNYALWKLKKINKNLEIKIAYIPYSVFGNEFELVPHEK